MQFIYAVLFIAYMVAGYWATGQTVYYNKIVIHQFGHLFFAKVALALIFGWVLIPAAFIMRWLRNR